MVNELKKNNFQNYHSNKATLVIFRVFDSFTKKLSTFNWKKFLDKIFSYVSDIMLTEEKNDGWRNYKAEKK